MQLAWFIAQRFRKAKRKSGFASFMSSSSTVGIGLGVAVLIIMLSVMNGFEEALETHLLDRIPQGEIKAVDANGLRDWQTLIPNFQQHEQVKLVQPIASLTGLAQRGKKSKAINITAVVSEYFRQGSLISLIDEKQWQEFEANPNGLIVGEQIFKDLGIELGDSVQVLLPQSSGDLKLRAPKSIWLQVVGTINLGGDLDRFISVMHLEKATETLNITTGAQGLQFTYHDPFVAPVVTRDFAYQLRQGAFLSDWTRTHGHLYQDIKLVRVVVYIALTLVIAVACFNVVSSLAMLIKEKQQEIEMLVSMGASKKLIRNIFMLQGMINGLKGMAIGTFFGVLIALNLTEIVTFLEVLFGIKLLAGDVYFIEYLPSSLKIQNIIVSNMAAISLCFLFTWLLRLRVTIV